MTTAQLIAALIVFGVPSIALIADALDARRLQRRAEQRRAELAGGSPPVAPGETSDTEGATDAQLAPTAGATPSSLSDPRRDFTDEHPGRTRLGINDGGRRR